MSNASVDVFNTDFHLLPRRSSGFVDPAIPAGYAPFGIQALNGKIFVTYGKQNAAHTDVVPGVGLGYVDVYTVNGVLLKHLISGGSASPLNEPWGLAVAPIDVGRRPVGARVG